MHSQNCKSSIFTNYYVYLCFQSFQCTNNSIIFMHRNHHLFGGTKVWSWQKHICAALDFKGDPSLVAYFTYERFV